MVKIVFLYVKYLFVTICACNVYDFIVSKDEKICKLLQNPTGIDDVILDEFKSVTKQFGKLAEEVKKRNDSVLEWAEAVHKRGEPRFLSQQYSLGKLKLHYNWGPMESNFFEFLIMNARFKWQDFQEEYKNYTIDEKQEHNKI